MKKGMSLGTAICLFIIIILIMGLIGMYTYYNSGDKNIENKNETVLNKEESKEENNDVENTNKENIEKISKKGTKFIIYKIESKGDK